jgi:tRNA 2-selenouridine synthase
MSFSLTHLSELTSARFDTIIDVRAPSEFAEDHVPGAINLPVLSDAERAHVGTIYVQDNPFKARKIGAALVARNAALHLEGPLQAFDGGWQPLVYCWRGGQRSGSFASILAQIGWRVETLDGGYQTYRRLVSQCLYRAPFPAPIVLLDGNTGTAKTQILQHLAAMRVQVLDLEGLAHHRGSVLGGQGGQPSQKGFESRLAERVDRLDPTRPVVVEAESSRIGRLNLPPRLFEAMKTAPRIEVIAPLAARAAYLTRAYVDLVVEPGLLAKRLERLRGLQGHARVDNWLALVEAGALQDLAVELVTHHYDPRYAKTRARAGRVVARVEASDLGVADVEALARDVSDQLAMISTG